MKLYVGGQQPTQGTYMKSNILETQFSVISDTSKQPVSSTDNKQTAQQSLQSAGLKQTVGNNTNKTSVSEH